MDTHETALRIIESNQSTKSLKQLASSPTTTVRLRVAVTVILKTES